MAQSETHDVEVPVISAIRAGDRYAFSELVRRHSGWVNAVIYGVLGDPNAVEDVAQQVWTHAWQRIGTLRDATKWRPWLYRLARNAALDAGRERSRRRATGLDRVDDWPGAPGAARVARPDRSLVDREAHREVLEAIAALPARYREPFVLRHLSGWTYEEIARVMGMPVDSIETRLVRARRALRDALRDKVGSKR